MPNALKQLRRDLLEVLDGIEEEAHPDPVAGVLHEEIEVGQLVRQVLAGQKDQA